MKLYRAGEHTISELEELFPVTRATIYRAITRAGAPTAPGHRGDRARRVAARQTLTCPRATAAEAVRGLLESGDAGPLVV